MFVDPPPPFPLSFLSRQTLGTACCLRDVAWHPHQHVLALAGYGQDAPVLLYCGEARADKPAKVRFVALFCLLVKYVHLRSVHPV